MDVQDMPFGPLYLIDHPGAPEKVWATGRARAAIAKERVRIDRLRVSYTAASRDGTPTVVGYVLRSGKALFVTETDIENVRRLFVWHERDWNPRKTAEAFVLKKDGTLVPRH